MDSRASYATVGAVQRVARLDLDNPKTLGPQQDAEAWPARLVYGRMRAGRDNSHRCNDRQQRDQFMPSGWRQSSCHQIYEHAFVLRVSPLRTFEALGQLRTSGIRRASIECWCDICLERLLAVLRLRVACAGIATKGIEIGAAVDCRVKDSVSGIDPVVVRPC